MSGRMSSMTKVLIDCVVVDDFAGISRNHADVCTFEDFFRTDGCYASRPFWKRRDKGSFGESKRNIGPSNCLAGTGSSSIERSRPLP
jgi:hypothetical protein